MNSVRLIWYHTERQSTALKPAIRLPFPGGVIPGHTEGCDVEDKGLNKFSHSATI